MKMMKLNYYNAEIYEKYKINNILSLLVDKHKLQNESLGLNDFGNKQNNYSIIALLGSQIKNINDEEYKNIDTNDIIFALSELKKLDEHIAYNESKNKNYILEMAKQMYYEYSNKGLISKEYNFNPHSPSFIHENLKLMNEINKEVEQYENKIFSLRAYSEEEKRKRDSLSHRRSNTSSIASVLNMNENENHIYFNTMEKQNLNGNNTQTNSHENCYKHTNEFFDKNTQDAANTTISEANRYRIKEETSENLIGDSYENYINLKKKKRNSTIEENGTHEKYEELNTKNVHTNMNYMSKEDISTYCNSNEVFPDEVLVEHNNMKKFNRIGMDNINNHIMEEDKNYYKKKLSQFSSHETNVFKDQEHLDFLKRKHNFERKDETKGEVTHNRRTINGALHHYNSKDGEVVRRKSIYSETNEKYPTNILSPYDYFTESYRKANSMTNKDIIRERKSEGFKRVSDMPTEDNISTSIYGAHSNSKNNTSRFFNNTNTTPNTTTNIVLENIDKAEQQLVTNHLKNSMAHNETVAKRMSSILLNPSTHQNETFIKTPYDINGNITNGNHIHSDGSVRKCSTNSIKHYNNSHASINKYSSACASDQLNHYHADSNNGSSLILSNVNTNRGTNMAEDSYKKSGELNSVNYMNRDRYNFPKDLNSNYPTNFMNFEPNSRVENHIINGNQNNNYNASPNVENFNTLSKNYSKSAQSIPQIYTNRYSRALNINDLNSNTSKNYANGTNSLKSDFTIRDAYSKILERSKSLTSQINTAPLSYKYLKANI